MPACAERVREGMAVSTNGETSAMRRTLTEMLLVEHLNANPGGRPNELTDLAQELGATAPFVLPDAERTPYDDRNTLMGYDPRLHPLQPLRPLHAGSDDVLGADVRGRGAEARIVPRTATRGSTRSASSAAAACPSARRARSTRSSRQALRRGTSRRSRRRRRRARSAASAARSTSTSTRRRSASSR